MRSYRRHFVCLLAAACEADAGEENVGEEIRADSLRQSPAALSTTADGGGGDERRSGNMSGAEDEEEEEEVAVYTKKEQHGEGEQSGRSRMRRFNKTKGGEKETQNINDGGDAVASKGWTAWKRGEEM